MEFQYQYSTICVSDVVMGRGCGRDSGYDMKQVMYSCISQRCCMGERKG